MLSRINPSLYSYPILFQNYRIFFFCFSLFQFFIYYLLIFKNSLYFVPLKRTVMSNWYIFRISSRQDIKKIHKSMTTFETGKHVSLNISFKICRTCQQTIRRDHKKTNKAPNLHFIYLFFNCSTCHQSVYKYIPLLPNSIRTINTLVVHTE